MGSIFEFPPTDVPGAKTWTKDTSDTIVGLSSATYVKYKTTVANAKYGNGEYVAWANSVYNYNVGSTYGATEWAPTGAFDKLSATTDSQPGWATSVSTYNSTSDSSTPAILYLKCPVAFVLKSYGITARTDATFYTQAPTSWILYGSMDGNYWTLIDTKTGQTSFTSGSTNTYSITNLAPYSHYQIVCYRNQSSTNTQITIGELKYNGIPTTLAAQTGPLEFPPREVEAVTWTKDTGDTITGVGGQSATQLAKYKYTLSTHNYGAGQYVIWADNIWAYGESGEHRPSYLLAKDMTLATVNNVWANLDTTFTNTADATTPVNIYFQCPIAHILRYYSIQGRTSAYAFQAPSKWVLYASTNGTAWTSIDSSRTAETTWGDMEVRTYYVNNTIPYRYYRLQLLRNNNATANNISFSEWRLYGTLDMPVEAAVLEFPPPIVTPASASWTKDTAETITGIGAQSATNLAKYKYIVTNSHPYGTGEYQAYANQL